MPNPALCECSAPSPPSSRPRAGIQRASVREPEDYCLPSEEPLTAPTRGGWTPAQGRGDGGEGVGSKNRVSGKGQSPQRVTCLPNPALCECSALSLLRHPSLEPGSSGRASASRKTIVCQVRSLSPRRRAVAGPWRGGRGDGGGSAVPKTGMLRGVFGLRQARSGTRRRWRCSERRGRRVPGWAGGRWCAGRHSLRAGSARPARRARAFRASCGGAAASGLA